jgi:hypothetical protein
MKQGKLQGRLLRYLSTRVFWFSSSLLSSTQKGPAHPWRIALINAQQIFDAGEYRKMTGHVNVDRKQETVLASMNPSSKMRRGKDLTWL